MSGQILFDRKYSLLIGPKYSGTPDSPNGILIQELRVSFKVEQNLEANPNTFSIDVYNLSPKSRSLVEENSTKVLNSGEKLNEPTIILNAGYGENIKNLFIGDIARVVTKRQGADIITTIEAGDGEAAFSNAKLDKSFAPGTLFGTVFDDVKKALGLSTGQVKGVNLNDQFINGLTLSGPVKTHLNKLMARQNLEWSIQKNQLQIVPAGRATDEEVIVLNSSTGLIGTPTKTKIVNQSLLKTKDGKVAESGVQVLALLNPDLRPGRRIQLESEFISGVFRIEKVTHSGDNYANEWYSELEVKQQ